MFSPANQPHFNLTVDGVDSDFQVLSFTGREALNTPFALTDCRGQQHLNRRWHSIAPDGMKTACGADCQWPERLRN